MSSKRSQRRAKLLDRFRESSVERLGRAAGALRGTSPSEAVVIEVRQALETIQGEAHMLGLASLSTLVEFVIELLMGRPTPAKFERAAVGVHLLGQWFEADLVEDQAAGERLDAHQRKLMALGHVRVEFAAVARA